MNPLISIIIPNYNREHLIIQTLESILTQTYTNWECIIVDDHSTDRSWEIVNNFCEKDVRFKQVRRPINLKKGACSCRNYGFELSRGKYVNWFDSDDIMVAKKLEVQLKIAEQEKSSLVICQTQFFEYQTSNLKYFWNKTFSQKNDPLTDFICFRLAWSINAPLWKKTFLNNKELFDISLRSSQDWEFHVRLLTYFPKFSRINETLVLARMHSDRIGTTLDKQRYKTRLASRMLVFDELKRKGLLNNNIKNYFKSFFMNQLKYFDGEEAFLKSTLFPAIKYCSGKMNWFLNFYPRIVMYFGIFRVFGIRYKTYQYLIKHEINENRI